MQNFFNNVERIANALEAIAGRQPNTCTGNCDCGAINAAIDGTVDMQQTASEAVEQMKENNAALTEKMNGTPSDAGANAWNPLTEPVEGRYPDQFKKDAIDAALRKFGVEAPKSWNYVKKHEKLHELAAANAPQQGDLLDDAPKTDVELDTNTASAMSWDEFAGKFKTALAGVADRAVAGELIKGVLGHTNITEEDVPADKYQAVLDALKDDPAPATDPAPQAESGDELEALRTYAMQLVDDNVLSVPVILGTVEKVCGATKLAEIPADKIADCRAAIEEAANPPASLL